MAQLYQILEIYWPNAQWSLGEDDYETLDWVSTDIPKPTEAEIRQYSDAVDALLVERQRLSSIENELMGGWGGEVYHIISALLEFCADVATKPKEEWDTARLLTQLQRLHEIESRNP